MIHRSTLLAILAVALLGFPAAASAAPPAPPGFVVGISPQTAADEEEDALMAAAGIRSVRLPLGWASVEPVSPSVAPPDWADFDRSVGLAAEHGMRVFPFVTTTPSWIAGSPLVEPVGSVRAGRAWGAFLRQAVRRYGPYGAFWRENPQLPAFPIRAWEIWNEENIVTFSPQPSPARYAKTLRIAGRAIHGADPGAQVVLGGLFGRPLQVPPNIPSGAFLNGVYRAGDVKRFFDGVALHPYVADASAMEPQIRNLRRVMRLHHDSSAKIYVTELGWGSDSFQTRWERGMWGQADELSQALSILTDRRRAWRIAGAWWFSWVDVGHLCQFCDSAGLLNERREAKPAWYRFLEWTGGDPDIVPRMALAE